MSSWLQQIVTIFLSAVVAYAVTAARVIREEHAKLRAAARQQLPTIFGGWIAEAEAINLGMSRRRRAYDSPANELYFGYKECSTLIQQTRALSRWERYLIKQFCARAFSSDMYDLARRIPPDGGSTATDDLDTHAGVDDGESLETKFSREDIVLALLGKGDFDGFRYYIDFNGRIATMRMHVRNLDTGNGPEVSLANARTTAGEVVALCERFQYPKLWRVPIVFVESATIWLRKKYRRFKK